MTCNDNRPDPQALFDRVRDMFSSTVLGGGAVIPESNEWYAVSLNYALAEEFHAISAQAAKEANPELACAQNLELMAARNGVYPLPAIPAQGYMKLTGTPGAALPLSISFNVGDEEFVTASTTSQPTTIGEEGIAVVRVRAVTPGAAGNVQMEEGIILDPIPGVENLAEVCGGTFCEGRDSESTEQFRSRYLERLRYTPRATVEWLKAKIEEWPCVTRAILRAGNCCSCGCGEEGSATVGSHNGGCTDCGCVDCGGKMHFYVMFDNSFEHGIAPSNILQELEDWIFGTPQGFGLGQAEIGVCGKIVDAHPIEVDVFVDISDCPTSTQLTQVREVVSEFFSTVEPSVKVSSNELDFTLSRLLGGTDVSSRFELVDESLGFGLGQPKTDDKIVYATNCFLEPDCDYILVPRNVTITSASSGQAGCP